MRGRPLLPRPGLVNACVAPRTTHLRYVAVLLDDGVALCAPSLDAGMTGFIHCDAPDVIACSADGALLCVATRRELRFYAVLTGANDDGLVAPAARLRGRPQPLHSLPRPCGLDVASLVPGAAPSSAHGVAAIVGGAGLTLTQTASDDGAAPESASHHRNCPLGGCRFSDDGDLIALAAMDGRLLVRRRFGGYAPEALHVIGPSVPVTGLELHVSLPEAPVCSKSLLRCHGSRGCSARKLETGVLLPSVTCKLATTRLLRANGRMGFPPVAVSQPQTHKVRHKP